jgi:predicted RNase H-like nuclease
MSMRAARRGAELPYQPIAGAVPCPKGWLAATGKLQGISLYPEAPQVFGTLVELLDYKPAYQIVALFAPIGLLDQPVVGGRSCDRQARRLLGWPRSGAIVSPPVRSALAASSHEEAVEANGGHLGIVAWQLFKKMAEVDAAMEPYWQRTVFEVHPELSFFQLNDDRPVRFSKHARAGLDERAALLRKRLPGIERVLDASLRGVKVSHLVDAAACLWTARRIASRAVARLPENPEWDELGLRMELVR